MKGNGRMTKLMGMVDLYMLMATHMREIGYKIKLMEKGFTGILMELIMKVNGFRTNSLEWVLKNGRTVLVMRGVMKMAKNKEPASLNGQKDLLIQEIL